MPRLGGIKTTKKSLEIHAPPFIRLMIPRLHVEPLFAATKVRRQRAIIKYSSSQFLREIHRGGPLFRRLSMREHAISRKILVFFWAASRLHSRFAKVSMAMRLM